MQKFSLWFHNRKVAVLFLSAVLLIITTALFIFNKDTKAATNNLGIMHMPVSRAKGASATSTVTTLNIFIRAGSPEKAIPPVGVAPTSSAVYIWPQIYYKDAGQGSFTATSTCVSQGLGFFSCNVPANGTSTSPRLFQYYLRVQDDDDDSYMGTSTSPFTINVQNTDLGPASISGHVVFGMPMMTTTSTVSTSTIILSLGPHNYTNYAVGRVDVNDWVYIDAGVNSTTTQVIATSSNSITIAGPVTLPVSTSINKKIDGVTIFAEGTATSTQSATSSTGFSLSNLATSTYSLIAFKTGFCETMFNGISAPSSNFKIYMPAGCDMGGQQDMGDKFGVTWTAPGPNMMGAPREIGLAASPILIGISKAAATSSLALQSTTSTLQNIFIKKMTSGSIQDITSSGNFKLAYQPQGQTAILLPSGEATSYNYGPDTKIIIYSTSSLDAGAQYIVELTNTVQSTTGAGLQGSRPEGGHSLMFNTSQDLSGMTSGQYGQGGEYMPPFVMGMMPQMGSFGTGLNTNIVVKFSKPMDSSTINSSNLKLCKVTNPFSSSRTEDCTLGISVSLDNVTKALATIDPNSNLEASAHYTVKVLGATRGSSGITIGSPDNPTMPVFNGEFDAGTATDTTPPKIAGGNYQNNVTGVSLTPVLEFGLNEGLDPTAVNSNTVKLKAGTSEISGTVEYDFSMNNIRFIPSSALMQTTSYTFTLSSGSSGIKDLTGNQLDGDSNGTGGDNYTLAFTTTGTQDTTAPKLVGAYADNYVLALIFNKPMRAVTAADTTGKWASSVLNLSNYTIKYCSVGLSNCSTNGTLVSTSSASVTYDAGMMKVELKNIRVSDSAPTSGGDYWLQIDNVTDLSGNIIDASVKTFSTIIKNSQETYGMVGPTMGGTIGPSSSVGGQTGTGAMMGANNTSEMGMMAIGVHPMNATAGNTTLYFVDLPTTVALANGSRVVLTFPSGFDVSNAIPDAYSPMRNDWNGPGTGTVTLDTSFDSDGISVDSTTRKVTLKLSISGTPNAQEFYHFDIQNIRNSTIPKDYGTPGYTVTIETQDLNGKVLETKTSMPFFITEAGQRTLTVGITATASSTAGINMATSTLKVVLGSPMTGPIPTEISFNGASRVATATFTGISDGEYYFFTPPSNTLKVCTDASCTASTSIEFAGVMTPDPIRISGSDVTKTYTITRSDNGIPINVILTGSFGSGNVDVFAGGPQGYAVKTVSGGSKTNATSTIYVPRQGEWNIGIGPEMPKGMMFMGPPSMPDWMPPPPVWVMATGTTGSPICVENSGTANDCNVNFTIIAATSEIRGYVKDAGGTAIPDAGVDAFNTNGFGMPSHVQTDAQGYFALKVAATSTTASSTSYGLNVFKPGLPSIAPKTVVVYPNNGGPSGTITDGNTTADVYLGGGIPVTTTNQLIIYIEKGGYTISGTVVDSADPATAKPVSKIPVWAHNLSTGEFMSGGTDQTGSFILYVKAGTWRVSAHTMEFGDLPPVDITITNQSVGNIVLKPAVSKANMATATGTVTIAGAGYANTNIWIEGTDSTGRRYENGAITASDGTYTLKFPAGSYTIHAYAPEYGEIGKDTLTAVSGGSYNKNFTVSSVNIATLSFVFTNAPSSTRGFVDVSDPTNQKGQGREIVDVSSPASSETIKIAAGSYYIRSHIPGFGDYNLTTTTPGMTIASDGKVTIPAGTSTITFTLPTAANQITISGTVTSGGSPVGDAFVWIGNMSFHYGIQTTASGVYSLRVPSGTYRMGVDKPGYSGPVPTDTNFTTSTTNDFVLTQNSNYITGQITNSSGGVIAGAWVWADKVNSATDFTFVGGWAGAQTDSTGTYKLSVDSSYWLVRAVGEGYQEKRNSAAVNGSSNPTISLSLSAVSGYIAKEPKSKSMIPSQGGTLDDRSNTGVKVVVPAAALGSDTNNARITVEETTALPKTNTKIPLKGKDINAYSSTDNRISTLSSSINLEITYSDSDIPAGYSESQLGLAYFDETTNQYVEVPATIDTENNTITAQISHLSVYAPVVSSGINSPGIPGTPTAVFNSNGSAVSLSWATSTPGDVPVAGYEVYRSTSQTGTFANISGDSQAGGGFATSVLVSSCPNSTCAWTDSNVQTNTTYYYKVAAFDNGEKNSTSSAVSNSVRYEVGSGGLPSGGDTSAPQISNIKVIPYDTKAVIEWNTNESSITSLEYGTTTSYGLSYISSELKTSHSVTLSVLTASTTYHYKLISKDANGNQGTYTDQTFVTLQAGATPVLSSVSTTTISSTSSVPAVTIAPLVTSAVSAYTFTKRLTQGSRGDEVSKLQEILAKDVEIYPEGLMTGYFGPLTKKAVQKFQKKYGIADETNPSYGDVGPNTRAKLTEISGVAATPATPASPMVSTEKAQVIEQIKAQIQILQEKLVQLLSELVKVLQEKVKQSQ